MVSIISSISNVLYHQFYFDNSVLNIASNWENYEPVRKVKRRIKGGAKEAAQPNLIGSYYKGMGGIDLIELPQDVRFDKTNHFQGQTFQGSCKMCKKKTKTICKKMQYTPACRTWQALF